MKTRTREDPAADHRTLREKLADMAAQTDSPEEARIAAEKLAALPPEPPKKTLSRAQILGTPDDRRVVGSRRLWDDSRRAYVVVDVVEVLHLGGDGESGWAGRSHIETDWSSPHDWDGVE